MLISPTSVRPESRSRVRLFPRLAAVFSGVLLLALTLIGSFGSLSPTDATWTDAESSRGQFDTVAIGPVEGLDCNDERSILGTGLLETELELTWGRPEGIPDGVPVTYEISWSSGSRSATTTETSYTYTAQPALLTVGLRFSVSAHVGSWAGTPTGYSASQIVVLFIPISISCGIFLGLL